ncbi:hypothetical protein [Erythrobacter litoralis]|uniref:Uncharacterized protein n=1 Tax=Erythrobacter litoralis (strain HTCC2594) TaxID=314225 RepID=Q2N944_ERYLH|nr:hypothetical protein [Erythrobacter litoralis]ABC63797.1 hypothetical protein ELI_08525 [Erythrobacter litoralis HTCC2594]
MTLSRVAPKLLAAFALLTLSGCVTYPDITQARSPCRMEPGGWCGFVRDLATDSYGYAMLASNAYQDEDTYTELGPRFAEVGIIPPEEGENRDGLAYSLFDEFELVERGGTFARGARKARVLAFRGTEYSSPTDIIRGSIRADQIAVARRVYAAESARLAADYPGLQLIVAGHSLGGALATQISIENPDIPAYTFNVSPFYRGDSTVNDGKRVAINERGEFLRFLRRYRSPPAADMLVVNCAPDRNAGKKHGIRPLADCLTWIAAYESRAALALVEPNGIAKPPVECGEAGKPHPGPGTTSDVPCIHRPRAPEQDAD